MLNTPRSFGIPGVSLRTGDHICALVFGQQQQRDSVLLPYVREGLRIGDKCTVAIDELDTADFFAKLAQGSAIDSVPSLGHVDVQTATHSKLNRGRFSLDEALLGWKQMVADARASHDFVRLGGDARRWLHQSPDPEDFVRYEAELSELVAQSPNTAMLCIYDLGHFGGDLLTHVLSTHHRLMLASMPFDNPYCLTAEEYIAARRGTIAKPSLPGPAEPYGTSSPNSGSESRA